MKAFPDPSNSPARHTRFLWISEPLAARSTCIRSFHCLEELSVDVFGWEDTREASLVQLRGFSPILKSLYLVQFPIPEIFNLICSFPLLENFTVRYGRPERDGAEWVAPSTSPKLTGTLLLMDEIRSVARGLLTLPGGLHFTKIVMMCPVKDTESMMDLILRCSDTLESLCFDCCFSSMFHSAPEPCQYLTA